MATGNVNPRQGKVIDIPAIAPTIGTATDLNSGGNISVPFTAGSTATGGPVFSYRAVSNPGSIVGTGTSSPIVVSGLTNDTSYTFTVAAVNPTGAGPFSAASNSVAPTGAPPSFESIATVTVGAGGSSTVTFSSIPSTYTHLQIRMISTITSNDRLFEMKFNSDSGLNYAYHALSGNGSSASAGAGANQNTLYTMYNLVGTGYESTTNFVAGVMDILDYSNTSKYKTVRSLEGIDANGSGRVDFKSGLWMSTSAINSISFTVFPNGTIVPGTQIALYGIKGGN